MTSPQAPRSLHPRSRNKEVRTFITLSRMTQCLTSYPAVSSAEPLRPRRLRDQTARNSENWGRRVHVIRLAQQARTITHVPACFDPSNGSAATYVALSASAEETGAMAKNDCPYPRIPHLSGNIITTPLSLQLSDSETARTPQHPTRWTTSATLGLPRVI